MVQQFVRTQHDLVTGAGRWFLDSGIHSSNGGVSRYYRCDLGKNARVSTEITGYAVSALLFFHRRSGQIEYLDSALRAARFLTRTAWDAQIGAFPFEHPTDGGFSASLAYFFDTGIIIRGLLAAWRVSHHAEFRDAAVTAGRAMLADFRTHDLIQPILALPNKMPLAHQPNWSASPGCYQLKAAMAWFEIYEVTGEICFRDAYESVLEVALASQYSFLPGESDLYKVMDRLHAYAYFLEGLLPVLDRGHCVDLFRKGIDRIAVHVREIGPIFMRSDVCAQLLRLRLYGEMLGVMPLNQDAAAQEAGQARAFRLHSHDLGVSNGFSFGRKGNELMPFVNPASTAFCVQALALWDDHKNGTIDAHRHTLI